MGRKPAAVRWKTRRRRKGTWGMGKRKEEGWKGEGRKVHGELCGCERAMPLLRKRRRNGVKLGRMCSARHRRQDEEERERERMLLFSVAAAALLRV